MRRSAPTGRRFPQTGHLGAATSLAPSNSMGVNTGFSMMPDKTVFLAMTGRVLWRTSEFDSLYGIGGEPIEGYGRFTGAGGDLFMMYSPAKQVSFNVLADVFSLHGPAPLAWMVSGAVEFNL